MKGTGFSPYIKRIDRNAKNPSVCLLEQCVGRKPRVTGNAARNLLKVNDLPGKPAARSI